MIGQTIFDKIWDSHVVTEVEGETLVYVDRLLIHEGSRHSFSMLRNMKMKPYRREQIFGFADHYIPTETTKGGIPGVKDKKIRNMLELMEQNTTEMGIRYFGFHAPIKVFCMSCPQNRGSPNLVFFFVGQTPTRQPMAPLEASHLASGPPKQDI